MATEDPTFPLLAQSYEARMAVVGKRRSFLNSRIDTARLAKYVAAFEALQAEFRCARR